MTIVVKTGLNFFPNKIRDYCAW